MVFFQLQQFVCKYEIQKVKKKKDSYNIVAINFTEDFWDHRVSDFFVAITLKLT
jgi:hypothetical protein